jgi:hypothetical protein
MGPQDSAEGAMRSTSRKCPATGPSRRSAVQADLLFLDFMGQLIDLGSEFRKGELMALFGTRMGWLEASGRNGRRSPRKAKSRSSRRTAFSQKFAQQAHILACAPSAGCSTRNKVRGRGAHRGDDGELVFHCGDAVMVGGRKGVKGRALEPNRSRRASSAATSIRPCQAPRPHDAPASVDVGRGKSSPASKHGTGSASASPRTCCSAGLARPARRRAAHPPAWLDRRAVRRGQDHAAAIPARADGRLGRATVEDATEAGVRQLLDQDTLAVMFDEIEAERTIATSP